LVWWLRRRLLLRLRCFDRQPVRSCRLAQHGQLVLAQRSTPAGLRSHRERACGRAPAGPWGSLAALRTARNVVLQSSSASWRATVLLARSRRVSFSVAASQRVFRLTRATPPPNRGNAQTAPALTTHRTRRKAREGLLYSTADHAPACADHDGRALLRPAAEGTLWCARRAGRGGRRGRGGQTATPAAIGSRGHGPLTAPSFCCG